MTRWLALFALVLAPSLRAAEPTPSEVLDGLKSFWAKTARPDGSFQPGIDPTYQGMSDSAASDLAPPTYAVTLHKTFGLKLPHEEKTRDWFLGRQQADGAFINIAGTMKAQEPLAKLYNTTQGLVGLKALGTKPKYDPLPIFADLLKQDYKTLPHYTTSFFPLGYLCSGQPFPPEADQKMRKLLVQEADGYMAEHVAATFHLVHYYRLVDAPTPRPDLILKRVIRDQKPDGSWMVNPLARDRHGCFDAVLCLKQLGKDNAAAQQAIQKAARWVLACRNADGGFGHYPGSPSDADAVYFHVGVLVMADFLKPVQPLPADPHLLSWGHLLPVK